MTKSRALNSRKNIIKELPIHIFFLIIAVICIFPLVLVLSISLSTEKDIITEGYRLIPKNISFEGYEYVIKQGASIMKAYSNTIFVTILGTILTTFVVALFAYPISRPDFKYKKFFTFFVLIPFLFNGGVVPWYIVCTRVLHLKNTLPALFVPYIMSMWYVLIMKTFFQQSIPQSLIESAKLDGAGEFLIFFKIVIPLAIPGLATIAFFTTVSIWNDYRLPLYLITDPEKYNIQYLLWKIQSNIKFLSQLSGNAVASQAQAGIPGKTATMAICVFAIGPIILAFPFFQKYFVQGLTLGSLKG